MNSHLYETKENFKKTKRSRIDIYLLIKTEKESFDDWKKIMRRNKSLQSKIWSKNEKRKYIKS